MDEMEHDLGSMPKEIAPEGIKEKKTYPCLNIDMDKFPALKEMKLGDTGSAIIKFKINARYGGINILSIKSAGSKKEEKKDGKKARSEDEGDQGD